MVRTIFAGIAGGIAMFLWTSIAHMATPLGEMGVQELPNEDAVLGAMRSAVGERQGLFIFPGFGLPPGASAAQQQAAMGAYEAKLKTHPSGIVVYNPPGDGGMTVQRLLIELASQMFEATMLALVLASTALGGFLSRLLLATAVGAVAVSSTNISYLNWYGFPLDYTIGYMATDLIGYVVAGIAILLIVRSRQPG
jgi:hypothetical protein